MEKAVHHWDVYSIFSIIAGISMIVMALIPGVGAGSRAVYVLFGVGFIGYAIYVSGQQSGVFVFPVYIFIVPFVALFQLFHAISSKSSSRSGRPSGSSHTAPAGPPSRVAATPIPIGSADAPLPSGALPPPPPPAPAFFESSEISHAATSDVTPKLKGKLAPP